MPDTANPYREDIAGFLRRAQCHFGQTLRDQDAGLTVEDAAELHNVGLRQMKARYRGVRNVLGGEFTASKEQAKYDEAVYRALLHFRGEMSDGLREHIGTRLNRLRTVYSLKTGVEPLVCNVKFDSPPRHSAAPPELPAEPPEVLDEPDPVPAPDSAPIDEVDELAYASPEERRKVDELAMKLATDEATRRWPTAAVTQMPHNNPGFDIEVQHPVEGTLYIEVKGTRSPEPAFFITAGEVEHSRRHPDRYSIWIFHAMDLDSGEATLTEHDGPVTESDFELRPVQYRGRYLGPR